MTSPGVCRAQPQDGDVTNVLFLTEGAVLLFVDWRVCFCTFVAGLLVVLLVVDRIGRKKSMALCFFIFSLFILPLYACIDRWVWLLRRHFVTFKQQSATCLSLCPRRIALTVIIFIARAFISAGFQVAFVYTPEVCQYFNHLKIIISFIWVDWTWWDTLACCPIGFSHRKQSLGDGNLQCDGQDRFPDYSVCVAGMEKPQHQSDIRLLHMRCSASLPGSSVFVFFSCQVMLRASVYLTLSIYCGCTVLAGIACLMLPIETLGRGLQESAVDQEAGQSSGGTTVS